MGVTLTATIDEEKLKQLVAEYISDTFGVSVAPKDLKFEVKSKNNYRPTEWEIGTMRVVFNKEAA